MNKNKVTEMTAASPSGSAVRKRVDTMAVAIGHDNNDAVVKVCQALAEEALIPSISTALQYWVGQYVDESERWRARLYLAAKLPAVILQRYIQRLNIVDGMQLAAWESANPAWRKEIEEAAFSETALAHVVHRMEFALRAYAEALKQRT